MGAPARVARTGRNLRLKRAITGTVEDDDDPAVHQFTVFHTNFFREVLDTPLIATEDACRAVVHSPEGVALRRMPGSPRRVLRDLPSWLLGRGARDRCGARLLPLPPVRNRPAGLGYRPRALVSQRHDDEAIDADGGSSRLAIPSLPSPGFSPGALGTKRVISLSIYGSEMLRKSFGTMRG
jgi:hypothetical protein